jgi:hypothetical protein
VLPSLTALKKINISETMIGKPVLQTGWICEGGGGGFIHQESSVYRDPANGDEVPAPRQGVKLLAKAVLEMPGLETLLVNNNDMFASNTNWSKDTKVQRMRLWVRVIRQHKTLKTLDVTGNGKTVDALYIACVSKSVEFICSEVNKSYCSCVQWCAGNPDICNEQCQLPLFANWHGF